MILKSVLNWMLVSPLHDGDSCASELFAEQKTFRGEEYGYFLELYNILPPGWDANPSQGYPASIMITGTH